MARLAAESVELLDGLAADDLAASVAGRALQVPALVELSAARRRNLLRYWLRQAGFEVPSADMLDRIDTELLGVASDALPLIRWPGCELRRYRGRLYAMTPLADLPDCAPPQLWQEAASLMLNHDGGLLTADVPPPKPLLVRRVRPGESFRIGPRAKLRSLKNLFQEAGLPPWLRARVPVLELDGQPACIAGVASSAAWRGMLAQSGWRPRWQHGFSGLPSPFLL
jgi:tRNA(Ile)-lysidine synthase